MCADQNNRKSETKTIEKNGTRLTMSIAEALPTDRLVASPFDRDRVIANLGMTEHGDIVGVHVMYLANEHTVCSGIVAPVGGGRGAFFHHEDFQVKPELDPLLMIQSLMAFHAMG